MKLLLLIVAAAVTGAVPRNYEQVEGYTFAEYVNDFGKKYSDKELAARKDQFEANLETIINHNKAGYSWKLGVNDLTAHFPDELKALRGVTGVVQTSTDLFQAAPDQRPLSELPQSLDWRKKGVVTPVKNQQACGSCWAFATTETVESHLAINTGKLVELAPQNLVSCVQNPHKCGGTGGCQGATAELGLDYVAHRGLAAEVDVPYKAEDGTCPVGVKKVAKSTSQSYATNDYAAVMNAIAKGPQAISIDASTLHLYSSGVFDGCNQTHPDINHGVQLVGYGTDEEGGLDYWIVRNSWGPTFGEGGFFRLLRHTDKQVCGTDITVEHGIACEGETKPQKVCGTCGVLFDVRAPIGTHLVNRTAVPDTIELF